MRIAFLNIEGTKHLPEQVAWLEKINPDVFCAVEIFRISLPVFEKLGYVSRFAPYANVTQENEFNIQSLGEWGLAMFSRIGFLTSKSVTYKGNANQLPSEILDPNSLNRVVMMNEIESEGKIFPIALTHLTWTTKGQVTEEQSRDTTALLEILKPYSSLLLCGDFNAPRGLGTWQRLAERYQDNIPANVTTTIDGSKHYAGNLQLVVDGLFSTKDMTVNDVQIHTGVSDHCGITATVV